PLYEPSPSLPSFLFPSSAPHPHLPSFPTRRSSDLRAVRAAVDRTADRRHALRRLLRSRFDNSARPPDERARRPHSDGQSGADDLDRKSTRLNSSHRTISYAVFCLKKKKTTHGNL